MKISEKLPMLEMACYILAIIGAVLTYANIDSLVLKLSLTVLAITFFARAFVVVDTGQMNLAEEDENIKFGFSDLLAINILPKVLWISTAISTMGLLLYLMEAKGYENLFLNGVATSVICLLILLMLVIKGARNIHVNYPILLRTIPIVIIIIYILLR